MMNNGTDIRKAMRAAKQSPKKQDGLKGVIYDQRGQYAFPGQVTKIQGDAYGTPITMAGVPYPMYGEDDLGYGQMMYPGMDYTFPGQYVTEIPMAQDGRNINSLEADLITKVLMNRNKNKDFIQRAYALGQNPGMFTLPDPDQFGYNMSHKMAWGEDETGQAYMFPTVMNPENESIKVPNQYADYISSIGYKKETGIPYEAYGGDLSLSNIEGHYPFGGMYSKTGTHFAEGGGWLDELDEEYRRGGGVNPLMKSRSKRGTTKKNIQSSINKIFLRNYDIFGPGGKNIYDPNSKYQEGGIPMAQSGLIAAPTTGSVPVSTKAPVNPVNPESTMGLLEFIKHRWDTRDKGPGDWDMGYVDPVTGNYVNTGVTPFDIMLPVQAVSGAKQAVSAVNKLTNSEKLIPKTSTYNKLKSNITNIKELGKGVKETFKEANKTRKFLKENWQDIKQIPDQYKTALKELTSEEGLKRLKELGVDDPDDFINYLKNIKLNTTTEGSHFFPVGPGSVNINPKQVKKLKETILPLSSQKVSIDHELGHAIQYYLENKGKTFNRLTDLDIDAVEALYPHVKENVNKFIEKTRGLTYDEVKKMAENLSESSANYLFRNKREPLSHLRETKRAMVDKGVISNIHETVTPEHIQEFILKGGDKDRILSFLQQTPEAKQTLSKLLNRTPAIIPIGLGVSAISENQKKLGGWLDNLD